MASSSSILMVLVCSLFLSHLQARALEPDRVNCSSSCGDIRNISYPFRLSTDPPGCGDPDYQLACDQSNRTVLQYLSQSYYVKHIWYNNSTIRLVDPKLATGSCSLPSRSFSYDQVEDGTDPRFIRPFATPEASFLNCSQNVSDPKYTRVPCLSTNTSASVYVAYGGHTYATLKPFCSFLSMVPLLHRGPNNTSYAATLELLESGFDLTWSLLCRDCLVSGGSCASTLLSDSFLHFCHKDNYIVTTVIPTVVLDLRRLLFGAVLFVRFTVFPLVVVVFLIHKYVKRRERVDNVEQFLRGQESAMPKRYSYTDITAITNHFRDKLGQGGFGSVYKGQLPGGYFIAVKMLNASSKFSGDDFINEVSTIGRIHHRNIVKLIGFCSEGSHRALVYEQMPNGSLDKHIFSKKGKGQMFSWEKILDIALGAAKGINYLHEGCDVCILHFDIKPHNVLLDHDFVPKVADFGLAKFYPKERDIVSVSTARGTIGYIAPELISRNFGDVSSKTDVYSFGMVLLEMAGGRRNVDVREDHSSRVYFPSWVHDHLFAGEGLGLVNVTESESKIAQKLCLVGLWCIQVQATDRPSMSRVVEMLEGSFEDLQVPPKPVFSTPQYMSKRDSQWGSSTGSLISDSVVESLYMSEPSV